MKNKNGLVIELTGIIAAAAAAILLGSLIIFAISANPGEAIRSLLVDPISTGFNFGNILNKATPLILTGLAIAIVFRTGVFSMGAEGQLYVGAFFGALVATYVTGLPAIVHIPLVLLSAMAGGALFGAIPGWLKGYLNVDEIVSTLMLNYVGIYTVSYLLNNVFKDPTSGGYARMPFIQETARLGRLVPNMPTHMGILIALLAAVAVYLYLYKTKGGYEMRMVGQNKSFAQYGGMNSKWIVMKSIILSGAVAGLAGIVEVTGLHGTLKDNFSVGLGFDGIIIALLARNHPIGVPVAAFFYAYLQVGAQLMQANSDVPRELATIIQVLLVILVSAQAIFTYIKQRRLAAELNKGQGGAENAAKSA